MADYSRLHSARLVIETQDLDGGLQVLKEQELENDDTSKPIRIQFRYIED